MFNDFSRELYYGQDGRQMILGDLLEYIITGRGYYFQDMKMFSKIIFYMVNQLLLQENVIRNPPLRKELLDYLEKSNLDGFFEGEDDRWKEKYDSCKTALNEEVIGARKRLYRVIDSVLPKSCGTATKLLVFIYLINSRFGHVVPLLLIQRLFGVEKDGLTPPDFLLIKDGKVFGLEVGTGPGGYGKIDQGNIFMGKTSIPVITLKVNPPSNNASFRCPECEKWILYCDKVIEKYSTQRICDVNSTKMECKKCPNFSKCLDTMYYGRVEPGGDVLHHHYKCVEKNLYVKRIIGKKGGVSPLLLGIEGLESFEE